MAPPLLAQYLSAQPLMKIIRSLVFSSRPRHVRDLAAEQLVSPAGAADILRRLKEAGVLRERREGNRRCVFLSLAPEEAESLRAFFLISDYAKLEERAQRFQRGAVQKLQWMDETFKFFREVKRKA